MRKCLLAPLLFFILIAPGYAQRFEWAKNLNASTGSITGMDTDESGNNYVTGSFYQTATFGSTTLNGNGTDIFVVKYDSAGTVQWARKAGGALSDVGSSISVDRSGNSYVIGYFTNYATFGSISVQAEGPDTSSFINNTFIAKYNPEGLVQWVKKISGIYNNSNQLKGIDIDPLGNVYVTGYMNGTTFFGSISLNGSQNMFVAKYSPNGDIQWAKRAGATSFVSGNALSVDGAGNSYVTGTFAGTATFGTTRLTAAGYQDVFVAKYNTAGNLVWVRSAGGSGYDEAKDIGVDQAGNCVVMGRFVGTAGFGGIIMTSANNDAIFIAKYSANGQVQWAKQLDVKQYYTGRGLSVDPIGSCYLTGFFELGIARFDNISLQNYGNQNAFIAKCDANGTFQWAQQVKSSGTSGINVATDATGKSYVLGVSFYQDQLTFGPIVLPSSRFFLTKLSSNANLISGRVFKDLNGNGTMDAGESPLTHVILQLLPGPEYTKSDSDGNYRFYSQVGNYTVSVPNPVLHTTVSPASRTVQFSELGTQRTGNDFALRPLPDVNDVRVTLTNGFTPRPGFTNPYTLTYTNVGTTTLSGTVRFEKDGLFEYVNSLPVEPMVNGNALSWPYTNLAPGQSRNITVYLKLPVSVALRTIVRVRATIDPVLNDQVPDDNTESLALTVVGSFDPNDKQVNPAGKISRTVVSAQEPFTYTIRFQNTGTASALTVKVLDTLCQHLAIPSFQMLSTSHPYSYTITGPGIVEWTFDNINLPDSNTNERQSHGFIKYRVKPKPTLTEGDTILNRSFIYFDYNAPIQTNTVLTRISDKPDQQPLATEPALAGETRVYPNPTAGQLNIVLPALVQPATIVLMDARGCVVLEGPAQLSGTTSLNISHLPRGLYLLRITHPQTTTIRRVVIE